MDLISLKFLDIRSGKTFDAKAETKLRYSKLPSAINRTLYPDHYILGMLGQIIIEIIDDDMYDETKTLKENNIKEDTLIKFKCEENINWTMSMW